MIVVLAALAPLGLALGGAVYEKTRAGNRLFQQGKYQDAYAQYTEALSQTPGPSESLLHYNLGAALYKQQKYDEAIKEFDTALAGPDSRLKEKTYYNTGNCYFRTGLAAKDLELLKKAAGSYQKALELDPNDQDAKHNLEVVRRHIKLQSEQPPPQPQPQQGRQKQASQEQPDQKKPEQKKPDQTKPGQEQKPEPKPPPGGAQPKELSKEEADRILNSLSEQQKEELKKAMEAQAVNQPSGKDW
jgi:tetratricopeptide (TPR) repeat protein